MKNPIQFLYFYAELQPDTVAIQTARSALTYAQLLSQVRSIARKLRQLGVRPGQVVVTALLNQQTDWIITLALMHEAVVTCSKYDMLPAPREIEADFVITEKALADIPPGKMILVDAAWFRDLPQDTETAGPQSYGGSDGLLRLILTSGTTGQSKAAAITVKGFMHRATVMTAPSSTYTKEIGLMGMPTAGGFYLPLRKLVKGLTFYVVASQAELIAMTHAHQIECLSGSPEQFGKLIEEMKRTSQRFSSLKLIWYGGAEASPRLLDAMRQMLCPNVACWYGSTEVAGVSLYLTHDPKHQPGMTGYVMPEVEVEIVNADRQPLACGEEGMIRTRAPAMAVGYYNNPEETQRSFHDGWFYPGDRGKLLSNGILILAGRESELINRGGGKIAPRDIEQHILEFPGVRDAAAFGFENHLGAQDICVALVVPDDFDMNALQAYLAQKLTSALQPALFVTMKNIPRNAMGKVLRAQLQEQHGEILRGKMAAHGAKA